METHKQLDFPSVGIEEVEPRSMTIEELANLYHLSKEELQEKLASLFTVELSLTNRLLSKEEVKTIFSILGAPCLIKQIGLSGVKTYVLPHVLDLLTESSWNFSRAILWGGTKFSTAEISLVQGFLKQYFQELPNERFFTGCREHLLEFLERVMIAKAAKDHHTGFIPHPGLWFNPDFPKGFNSTKPRYLRILARRKLNPHYCSNNQRVCELYLEHILHPSPEVFRKASKAFSYRDSNLLLLFCTPLRIEHPHPSQPAA